MIVVRIDKHPSNGGHAERIETITIANVNQLDGIYGVWRDGRSIQEAPDYTVNPSDMRPSAQDLAGLALIDLRGI